MKQSWKYISYLAAIFLVCVLITPSLTYAAAMLDYCASPPFIAGKIKPNLLLFLDNSASMYDLAWQDTGNTYCANAPTTSCTSDSQCPSAGSCVTSVNVSTATTWSQKACTLDTQCPNSTAQIVPKPCSLDNDCPTFVITGKVKDGCSHIGTCKVDNITIPKCNNGFCANCNTSTGIGDCTSSTSTVYNPVACSGDSTCSAITAGDTCNNKCNATRQCYDTTYSPTTTYTGYFDSKAIYSYNFTNNNFTSGAAWPGSCTYSAGTPGYFCVNTSGTPEAVVGDSTGFVANGNFLNWLSASKFDLEKQILTGGKYDTTSNVLVAETRACSGRKFIKAIPGVNLTFAIRGGTPGGIGSTQNQGNEYGQTYIEIYSGTYNATDCLNAMNDWMTLTTNPVNLGSFQNDTKGCVGAGNGAYNAINIWNHILHNCYSGVTTKAQDYTTNLLPLEGECSSAYASIAPSDITDPNSGISICSSVLSYTDAGGTARLGYLGTCWNGTNFTGPCSPDDVTQMANFCTLNVNTNPVIDPTSTALQGAGASAPGFILEQGLMNTTKVGTLIVQIAVPAPLGLINTYANSINMGAMIFNNNGSGSECSPNGVIPCSKACSVTTTRMCFFNTDCPAGELCIPLTKADGGKIVSYIGDPTGDHSSHCSVTTTQNCNVDGGGTVGCPTGEICVSSGLIRTIDNIQATSWTPFAEAFYTAVGYFAAVQVCSNDTATSCKKDSDCIGGTCVSKRVCTNDINKTCSINSDCGSPPATCGRLSRDFRLQTGTCSLTTSKTCSPANSDCPAGELCVTGSDKGDYNLGRNPSEVKCQKNNVLLVTDGMSTADQSSNIDGATGLATLYAPQVPNTIGGTTTMGISGYDTANSCPRYLGSRSISELSWVANHLNIKTLNTAGTASTTANAAPVNASESIVTYVVYSGPQKSHEPGLCDPNTLMTNVASNGGTSILTVTNPSDLNNKLDQALAAVSGKAASGTAASVLASGEGSGANLVQAIFYPSREVGADLVSWTGKLQNFWYFIDPRLGNSTIMEDTKTDNALKLSQDDIVAFVYDPVSHDTTVGTAPFGTAGVPSPTVCPTGWTCGISLDNVHYLWEAGKLLLGRTAGTVNGTVPPTSPASSSARAIFTNTRTTRGTCSGGTACGATSDCPGDESCVLSDHVPDTFDINNSGLASYLNVTDTSNLIKYVRGIDDLNGNGVPSSGIGVASPVYDTDAGDTIDGVQVRNRTLTQDSVTGVWKLGDIVNSTPKILSWMPINTYYEIYSDDTYKTFTSTDDYKSRGMVFAGANDGMLHAIKLGLLGLYSDSDLKASLGTHCSTKGSQACVCSGGIYPCSSGITPACPTSTENCVRDSDLGQEMWAFIPKNSLPYLKYTADRGYCHLYFIDAQPFIFDASYFKVDTAQPTPDASTPAADLCTVDQYWNCKKVTRCIDPAATPPDNKDCSATVNKIDTANSSWRTVLIGSMRLGGACNNSGSTCQDCTKTPMNNVGYSSYFALDITDPMSPKVLWEFSNPALGFSTSGPAIVRVTNPNTDKKYSNGRWLAIFGSGPTGWISADNNMAIATPFDTSANYGSNPHNMKLFVVDVATGALVTTIDTGEQAAFAGSLLNGTMDFDQDDLSKSGNYRDDAVYFGYTKGYVPDLSDSNSYITQGLATGGSVNTMKLAPDAVKTDDYYKGNFILTTHKDASEQWNYEGVRLITGYSGTTQTVTVDSNFPTGLVPTNDGTTQYSITKGWTTGGVKRLLTKQDTDPTNWAVSTVISGIGPVTASVKKIQQYSDNTVRLFFGTGRYYYRMGDLLDDPSNSRAIYGVKELCYGASGIDTTCTAAATSVGDATLLANGITDPTLDGWSISLDGCRAADLSTVNCMTASGVPNPAAVFKAERVVTDPLAATSGAVLFSSITPTSDPCEYGGRSYLWAVRFDTGGTLVNLGILKGKAIIQRSTGDIEQIDLATAFKASEGGQAGERKTTASFGLTGSGGISIVVPPQPINRILHIQKR